jgi:hypothetical protein
MNDEDNSKDRNKWVRGAMNAAGGVIPFAGGFISAAAGVWSESEQEAAMDALRAWIRMLEDELAEKQRTIIDIMSRLDMQNEEIAKRVRSDEYQSLLRKAFRNWAGTESKKKQEYVRNILTNSAATSLASDDVISLFLKWLQDYSEFHFSVIGSLYSHPGSTRAQIWENLGRERVREDSADADLFKLLIRDLSTGGIIRQHRPTDGYGNFLKKPSSAVRGRPQSRTDKVKSAFDGEEQYELTALGDQFVHYAMNELTVKIAYSPNSETAGESDAVQPA